MVPRRPNNVTDPNAVKKAMKTSDRMGREAFRDHYGFRKSTGYFVRHEGRTYDSKPLIAVAFGYQHRTKPLLYNDFSGGKDTVKPALVRMGFVVIADDIPNGAPAYRSQALKVGGIYTREALRAQFGITDATLNNGVFKPAGSRSIWLFVTKHKTADRPQLDDDLAGDTLHWSGQPKGGTDNLIIDHLTRGDEILLFYRDRRNTYPDGGFRYEGPFLYRSHSGAKPAAFVLVRDVLSVEKPARPNSDEEPFDPTNIADGRAKTLAQIVRRQGQGKFRRDLIAAYGGRCAVTGCDVLPLLEAAHIRPYLGAKTNHITNGLLLRADIHSLFDLGLIGVRSDHSLDICPTLATSDYGKLTALAVPVNVGQRPSANALAWHLEFVASGDARQRLAARARMP